MHTLTHEERVYALSKILSALQDAAAHQTDEDFKKFGASDLFKAVQLCKRMIQTVEFEMTLDEANTLDTSLGLNNIQ